MPVEIMATLVDDQLKAYAPSLANLNKLRTAWMNGIQFYLAEDVPLEFGHSLYADSPWALTSISQRQFWSHANLSDFGDGKLGGLLSVDISDWETPGILYNKTAMQCSAAEIEDEVWAQIKLHLNVAGAVVIRDANLLRWFLDPDVEFPNPTAAFADQHVRFAAISARSFYRDSESLSGLRLREDVYRCGVYGSGKRSCPASCQRAPGPGWFYLSTCFLVASHGT